MNPTPEQIEALNRAIAEYCGWKYHGEINGRSVWLEREDTRNTPPIYTSDLNAIVDVVREWCTNRNDASFFIEWYGTEYCSRIYNSGDWIREYSPDSPAIALCIVFAKAAGLDLDGKK
jgi:hypothetical protein